MSAIGIDIGTMYCFASWVNPGTKQVELIDFIETGGNKLPSVVLLDYHGQPSIGSGPNYMLEHLMGRSEAERIDLLQHTVQSIKLRMRPDGRFRVNGRSYSHVDIIAEILKKIKNEAVRSCPSIGVVSESVLTYPLYFEEWQKDMYRKASEQAGFSKTTLIAEPIAATISFLKENGMNNAKGVVICNYGAGTFSATYVLIDRHGGTNEYHIAVPPRSDNSCGGKDLDMLLYKEWDKRAHNKYGRSIAVNKNEVDINFLFRCRKQKELMSQMPLFDFNELLPFHDDSRPQRVEWQLSRDAFNEIISPVIYKTVAMTTELLGKVVSTSLPVDCIVLTGGGSRIPFVRECFEKTFRDVKIVLTGKADTAVVLGAMYDRQVPEAPKFETPKPEAPKFETPNPSPIPNIFKHKSKSCTCYYCKEEITTDEKYCLHCGHPNIKYKP